MKKSKLLPLIICIGLFCPQYLSAQMPARVDTGHAKWRNALVDLQSVYSSKEKPFAKDTLRGTAFLLTDNGKLYLVTAKHLLQADLYGKDQQLSNDSIYIRPPMPFNGVWMNISGLSGKERVLSAKVLSRQQDNGHKSAVIFTDDEKDIAVISLQKPAYKNIAAYLLTQVKPIPVALIDAGNNHEAGEQLALFQIGDFLTTYNGVSRRMHTGGGFSTGRIDQYDKSAYLFTVKSAVMPGNNGGPVTANDRLIGMLTNATGIVNNHDIIKNPYYNIKTGRVIKSAYILSSLHQLQQLENERNFDN